MTIIKYTSIVLAYLVFLFPFSGQGQDLPKYVIYWNPDRLLLWSDFKASQGHLEDDQAAEVFTGLKITLDYNKKQDTAFVDVISYMDPKKSSKRKTANGDYLLRHEQLHFDICEWYARLLRREITLLNCSAESLSKNVMRIYDKMARELATMQRRYDNETRHSLNEEKQAEWDKKVSSGLSELREYSFFNIKKAL